MTRDRSDDARVAVVTGGASGIGLVAARKLAAKGYRLVLADVETDRLEKAVAELGVVTETLGQQCDVSDVDAMRAVAARTYDHFGRADVVYLNAGVVLRATVADTSHDAWSWVLNVNLWGAINGVDAFLPRMRASGNEGHLLFTASFAGLVANEGLGAYCVSKYGVVALAEVLHRELRDTPIGVSVLCPMRVVSDIRSSDRNRPQALGGPEASPKIDDPTANMAGRVLPTEQVADLVLAAIGTRQLYVFPHEESREPIRRRFSRIEKAFDA
jgi:NAD(P)-dependent dehydrogenase (short-subunit alcohol dehydrogenase family)